MHVIVIGAGFGGLAFAQHFPDGLAEVTVIDRTNHHLFQPLLYQVAAAGLAAPDIAQPVRAILAPKRNVSVRMDEVTSIDLAARRVGLGDTSLAYDYLVCAPGGRTSYFGHPEWERHAPGLKSIGDALRIRREVLAAVERAEKTADPAERRPLLTIVVIGGGPTGVELAGAFSELLRHVLPKDFRHVEANAGRVILLEAGPRLLAGFPPALAAKAQRQLETLGVLVRVDARVQDITAGRVTLTDDTVSAANIIWAAGVAANPLVASLGVPTDPSGRVAVRPDLSLPDHPDVFVIGDSAAVIDANGVAVPGISPAAMQMGTHVARLLAAEIRAANRDFTTARLPFRYRDKGTMATIGRSRAVARIGRLQLAGLPAWLLWLFVHLLFLVGFRNKLSVLMQWVYSYVTYRPGARLIYPPGDPLPPARPAARSLGPSLRAAP